jgi:prepilin-type N-terminal cleavage/methylation domain-containing protein
MIKIRNQQGFSMIEMLVGSFVLLIFLLALFTMLSHFQGQLFQTRSLLLFEDQVQNFNLNLRRVMRNAVNTVSVNGAVNTIPSAAVAGQIRVNFNSLDGTMCQANGVPGNNPACVIGIFLRESAKIGGSAAIRQSDIRGTGFYYLPPVLRDPGFLILDLNTDPGSSTLSPDQTDLYFGNVVAVQLLNPTPAAAGQILRSVDLSVTFRKYINGTPDRWSFCVPTVTPFNAGDRCSTDSAYRDRTEVITILFKNNFDPANPILGTYGRAYFFQ